MRDRRRRENLKWWSTVKHLGKPPASKGARHVPSTFSPEKAQLMVHQRNPVRRN